MTVEREKRSSNLPRACGFIEEINEFDKEVSGVYGYTKGGLVDSGLVKGGDVF